MFETPHRNLSDDPRHAEDDCRRCEHGVHDEEECDDCAFASVDTTPAPALEHCRHTEGPCWYCDEVREDGVAA